MAVVASLYQTVIRCLVDAAVTVRGSSPVRRVGNALRFRGGRFVTLGDRNSNFYRPG